MAGLQLTITNAGRAALVNAQNTGSAAVVVTQIGVSATHYAGALASLTAIPAETKRLATFGGSVVAADTFHLSIRDETADVYTMRLFGLYLGDGTLFAVYSQAGAILEKSAAATLLLAVDVILTALGTAALTFGATDFLNPPATTTVQGVVELATPAETAAGTDGTRAVTPLGLIQTLTSWATNFAAAVHNHDASAIISGVLQVGRIPALGMEKITGLAAALAAKANLAAAVNFANVLIGGGRALLYSEDATNDLIVRTGASAAEKFFRFGDNGDFDTLSGSVRSGGALVWHASNFNPADKAAAVHSHDWAQVTGKPNLAVNGADASFNNLGVNALTVGGYSPWTSGNFDPNSKAAATHSHDWAQVTGKPNLAINGQNAAFADLTASRGDGTGVVFFGGGTRYLYQDGTNFHFVGLPLLVQGYGVWTSGNFDPNSKAAASHTHDWSQITGKPDLWSTANCDMIGARVDFPYNYAPAGFLKANGAEVSRTTYAALFARYGTSFGAGDGVNTFNLPDWRGEFFRAWDDGRGVDPGRALGSWQDSQNLAHSHAMPVRSNANSGDYFVEDADTSGAIKTAFTELSGGNEARPRNIAQLACVKY